ncbi:hypothetical protein RHGRI_026658 [Rhododendron griersonianum]|uniref:Protein kinase domain-containing protein n=1 Tax=Rhododendron griersonianum TaxID=479676 RepID=A0AAV6IYL2_9ERIC|nr:hypothetical protein RHGRI_026658 [Rhododendron griersonianum]
MVLRRTLLHRRSFLSLRRKLRQNGMHTLESLLVSGDLNFVIGKGGCKVSLSSVTDAPLFGEHEYVLYWLGICACKFTYAYFLQNNISREAQTMILADHPNVLKLHCLFVIDHNLWVIMPFMAGGSCLHILKAVHPDGFEEVVIATILREVLKGLEYVHHQGRIHRDVKAMQIYFEIDAVKSVQSLRGLSWMLLRNSGLVQVTADEYQLMYDRRYL